MLGPGRFHMMIDYECSPGNRLHFTAGFFRSKKIYWSLMPLEPHSLVSAISLGVAMGVSVLAYRRTAMSLPGMGTANTEDWGQSAIIDSKQVGNRRAALNTRNLRTWKGSADRSLIGQALLTAPTELPQIRSTS